MAADQPSAQSIALSSDPHGTRCLRLVGVTVGADHASPSSIAADLLPSERPCHAGPKGFVLACFLLARHGPLGHV